MAIRVKGDLSGLTIRPEVTYGTTPASATNDWYGGTLESFKDDTSRDLQEDPGDGTMKFSQVYTGMHTAGFTATFTVPNNKIWVGWLELVMGEDAETFLNEVPSFSAEISVSSDSYFRYVGCKVNTLEIAITSGEPVKFTVGVYAKACTFVSGDRTIVKQLKPAVAPLIGNQNVTYTYKGTSRKFKSSVLSFGRELQREPYGTEASGLDSVPTTIDATVALTETSQSTLFDADKAAGTKGIAVNVVIDGVTIALKNCYLPGDDQPTRSQATYDETVTAKAQDVEVIVGV